MAPGTVTTATGTSVLPFAITTTYTAPTQCAQAVGGLTMLEDDQYRVWLNAILPVPGTTITSCYPSQYISSFLLQTGGVSQAAFSPLVCPAGYTTQGPFTSNYIACCPSGWDGLALATNAPSDRPAFGGTCYSNIYNVPISVSFYDNSALKATSIFTATDISAQAFAYPYEGFALGVAIVHSIPNTGSSSQSTSTSTSSPVSSSPASSSSAASSSVTSSPETSSPAAVSSSHKLSSGAIAGAVVSSLAGLALLVAFAFLILRHRRKNSHESPSESEREFRYGGSPDPNAPNASYYNVETKELYGSQEVKNHGEPQELQSSGVYEIGDPQSLPAVEMGRNGSVGSGFGNQREREKKLPDLPRTSPVSPEHR